MFTIYSKPSCSFCTKSKELLNNLQQPFEEINIEEDIKKHRKWMSEKGLTTVPQIYFLDEYVGGYTELMDWVIDNDFV